MGVLVLVVLSVVVELVVVVEVGLELVLVMAGIGPVIVGPTTGAGACVEVHALTPSEPSAATDTAPSRRRRASAETERHPRPIPRC
jgi:hypothetical protein